MKNKLFSLAAAMFAVALPAAAHAQFAATLDYGVQKTKYGSAYDTSYKTPLNNSVQYAQLGASFLMSPHVNHKYGYNFVVSGDFQVPFNNDTQKGGMLVGGGVAQANFRYKNFSVGSGLDVHFYTFASDTGALERPDEWLVTIPVQGKFTFGPAGKAFVQGGVGFAVANSESAVDTLSDGTTFVSSNAVLTLSKTRQSQDIRASAGYMFGKVGVRASYVFRDVYFDVTANPTSGSYYDFHEQTVSGGVILAAF